MYYQMLYPDTKFYVCADCPDGITRENWKDTEEGIRAVTWRSDSDDLAVPAYGLNKKSPCLRFLYNRAGTCVLNWILMQKGFGF